MKMSQYVTLVSWANGQEECYVGPNAEYRMRLDVEAMGYLFEMSGLTEGKIYSPFHGDDQYCLARTRSVRAHMLD